VLAGVVVTPGVAHAKCRPNRPNDGTTYWDGRTRQPGVALHGVTSWILNYSPWVQPGSAVTAWSMLTRAPAYSQWAQIGWLEWAYDERVTLVQYTPHDKWEGITTVYFPAEDLGVSTEYRVEFWSNQFHFYLDGTYLGAGAVNWSPNEAQLAGEIKTLASQMPGGINANEWFSLSKIYTSGWVAFGGAGVQTPAYPDFRHQELDAYQQRIWDARCGS
jgi:hypothetical protein